MLSLKTVGKSLATLSSIIYFLAILYFLIFLSSSFLLLASIAENMHTLKINAAGETTTISISVLPRNVIPLEARIYFLSENAELSSVNSVFYPSEEKTIVFSLPSNSIFSNRNLSLGIEITHFPVLKPYLSIKLITGIR